MSLKVCQVQVNLLNSRSNSRPIHRELFCYSRISEKRFVKYFSFEIMFLKRKKKKKLKIEFENLSNTTLVLLFNLKNFQIFKFHSHVTIFFFISKRKDFALLIFLFFFSPLPRNTKEQNNILSIIH